MILNAFKHSDASTYLLTCARDVLKIGQGLESIGNTRFASLVYSVASICRCWPALVVVCQDERCNLKVSGNYIH